jgi:pimeloyl-ACP methyl ester carboxylesterase
LYFAEYLAIDNYNVILVDWSSVASNIIYPTVRRQTDTIGELVSQFLNYLQTSRDGLYSTMHCIGHSLGAHICNEAAKFVGRVNLGRVTNLDPAGVNEMKMRPIRGIAKFTDIIHTSFFAGDNSPLADADFYPNGGNRCKFSRQFFYRNFFETAPFKFN